MQKCDKHILPTRNLAFGREKCELYKQIKYNFGDEAMW